MARAHLITCLHVKDIELRRSFSQLAQPGEIPSQTSNSACTCIQILNEIVDYVL